MSDTKEEKRQKRRFYISIPKINGEDPQISAFCSVNYDEPSMVIKVHKKSDAQLIRENLEKVLNGTDEMMYGDSLKKRLHLEAHATKDLVGKITVEHHWIIIPLFYEVR